MGNIVIKHTYVNTRQISIYLWFSFPFPKGVNMLPDTSKYLRFLAGMEEDREEFEQFFVMLFHRILYRVASSQLIALRKLVLSF